MLRAAGRARGAAGRSRGGAVGRGVGRGVVPAPALAALLSTKAEERRRRRGGAAAKEGRKAAAGADFMKPVAGVIPAAASVVAEVNGAPPPVAAPPRAAKKRQAPPSAPAAAPAPPRDELAAVGTTAAAAKAVRAAASRKALLRAVGEPDGGSPATVARQLAALRESRLAPGHGALTKTYAALMSSAYSKRPGDTALLGRVWEEFYERGAPSVEHFTTAIAAYTRAGDAARAMLAYRRMAERGVAPDLACYNAVLRLVGVSLGRIGEMLRIFGEMKRRRGVSPDVRTYSILLEAYARHGGGGGSEEDAAAAAAAVTAAVAAEKEAVAAAGPGATPAVAAARDGRAVTRLFEEMVERGLAPNEVAYTSLVRALGRAGNLGGAVRVLESAEKSSGAPPAAYHALIRAFGASGDLEGARRVMARMRAAGVRPAQAAHMALMRACVDCDELGAAVDAFTTLRSQGRPSSGAYAALFDALVLMERDPRQHAPGHAPAARVHKLQREWLARAREEGAIRALNRKRGILDLRAFGGPGAILILREALAQLEAVHRRRVPFHLPRRGLLVLVDQSESERAAGREAQLRVEAAAAERGRDDDAAEALDEEAEAAAVVAAHAYDADAVMTPREIVAGALRGVGRPMRFSSKETNPGVLTVSLDTLDRLFRHHKSARKGPVPDSVARHVRVPPEYWTRLDEWRERSWARGSRSIFLF